MSLFNDREANLFCYSLSYVIRLYESIIIVIRLKNRIFSLFDSNIIRLFESICFFIRII